MATTDFPERYKSYSVLQLVEIIENRSKYQPGAVAAAGEELKSRNTSQEEISAAKNTLLSAIHEQEDARNKRAEKNKKILNAGTSVVKKAIAGPVTDEPLPINRTVVSISIFFVIVFLVHVASLSSLVEFMFTDIYARWDLSMVFLFEPLWFLPIAIVLFWMRKPIGWFLLAVHLAFTLFLGIGGYVALQITFSDNGFEMPSGSVILGVLFYGGTLYFICRRNIRELFRVPLKLLTAAIVTGGILCIIGYSSMYSQ